MRRTLLHALAAFVIGGSAIVASAQVQGGTSPEATLQAFGHYEMVRAALASDRFDGVASHATALAAVVAPVGGADAKKAAEALAAAKTIEEARTHFGDLSTILVPVFQAAMIPGTTAFMCGMKQKAWVQKGDKVENPYYGKAMLTCGSVLPTKGK